MIPKIMIATKREKNHVVAQREEPAQRSKHACSDIFVELLEEHEFMTGTVLRATMIVISRYLRRLSVSTAQRNTR